MASYELHIEVRPLGTFVGEETLRELARDGYVLHDTVHARDQSANDPAEGKSRYIFYKFTPSPSVQSG